MPKNKIAYGGWYQRTTLHLSEIYDFLAFGTSNLDLEKRILKKLHNKLGLESVSRETGYLEHVLAKTNGGITIRYYEDGLYVLETDSDEPIEDERKRLETYFEKAFHPAVGYIFSLGAPTPKVLANIKTTHPTVVTVLGDKDKAISVLDGEHIYSTIESGEFSVYKTHDYMLVVAPKEKASETGRLVDSLIFFREFKDQLEKYLRIHRTLWEEISEIKERKEIRGNDVEDIRGKLDGYQTTISLIGNRINQMGSYVRTRASISKGADIERHLVDLFQYKFETLTDTLEYIKEIWKMTGDYLNSSIQNLVEIKGQSAARGIQSLQLITSIGVVSGIVGYLSRNELPKITAIGAFYFLVIIGVTWLLNFGITKFYKKKKYRLKFSQRKEDI